MMTFVRAGTRISMGGGNTSYTVRPGLVIHGVPEARKGCGSGIRRLVRQLGLAGWNILVSRYWEENMGWKRPASLPWSLSL